MAKLDETKNFIVWQINTNKRVLEIISARHGSWENWIDKTRARLEVEQRHSLDRDPGFINMLAYDVQLNKEDVIEVTIDRKLPHPDADGNTTRFVRNMFVNANELDKIDWETLLPSFTL